MLGYVYIMKSKLVYHNQTCTPMFIVVLFMINKIHKPLTCSLPDEGIKKICYLYTMEV